jgi:hypothetical protein
MVAYTVNSQNEKPERKSAICTTHAAFDCQTKDANAGTLGLAHSITQQCLGTFNAVQVQEQMLESRATFQLNQTPDLDFNQKIN